MLISMPALKQGLLWVPALILFVLFASDLRGADIVDFNRDIRPILSDHCFACHGPDQNKREADVRFDTEEGLFGPVDASESVDAPVVRGDSGASELMHRVLSTDEDVRMPPPEFGKDLTAEQVELLRNWIDQGAAWQGHWSFQPIVRPTPPIESSVRSDNPIDAFVLRKLSEHQLTMSAQADRRTLVRRLYFDLLGLPAPPAVVEQFVKSQDPGAYELLVDELLASPHYGERMAMWWLDLVRYADSVGYHGDQPVSVSPFRDYVIASFNENKPFDQFTIEQLAGDLLPEPTQEQTIAAGYNRLGMMSAEGGVQPKEYLAKYIAERVRNLGGTWLGVTLGCCECHDHKYDPFLAKDFYRFEAFFADIEERGLYGGNNWGPNIQVPSDEQKGRIAELDAEIASVQASLESPPGELAQALIASQAKWEAEQISWQVLKPSELDSSDGTTLEMQEDGSIRASGKSPDTDNYTLTFGSWPADFTALRIEALPDPSLPKQGPGRAGNGNFVLSEFEVSWIDGEQRTPVQLQNASATYEQTGAAGGHPDRKWSAASAIDGDARGKTWGWAVMEQVGQANSAIFEVAPSPEAKPLEDLKRSAQASAEEEVTEAEGSPKDSEREKAAAPRKLQIVLKQQLDNPKHTLGHFRILSTSAALPVVAGQLLPRPLGDILATPVADRTSEQVNELARHYRTIAPELDPQRTRLKQLQDARAKFDNSIPTMLVTKRVEPRMVRVLARGNWMDDQGDEVRPGIPALLGGSEPADDRRLTRMDLAQWVVAQENPLTARVFVNRLWRLFFGIGLSSKLDDLGAQGEWPSHPELLEWMADEFRSSGWNVQRMIKLIVTSDAYLQDSLTSPQIAAMDPYNRLVSHQGRWRLDAEVVRDTLLSCSGLLVDSIGGESVKPYQPPGYWSYLNFPQREWANGQGPELYRRGLYTHWQRQYLHPSLLAFDAPSREECTADRTRSNTPLQALVLLNDPTYVEAAKAFAIRIMKESGDATDEARMAWAVRTALARSPRTAEMPVLLQLLAKHREDYGAAQEDALKLLETGASPVPSDADAVELAAWTSVARTLLNLHETITRN